jgi:hypothetical protein
MIAEHSCEFLFLPQHDGADTALFRQTGRRGHWIACQACVTHLASIGITLHPERRADPQRADRGRFSLGPLLKRQAA